MADWRSLPMDSNAWYEGYLSSEEHKRDQIILAVKRQIARWGMLTTKKDNKQ